MKLLKEEYFDNLEILHESDNSGSNQMFIEGHFIQTNKVNRNKRLYESKMMEPVVEKYIESYVNQKNAWGEFEHPDYPLPNPKLAAIRICEMKWDGDNVYGKAIVLNTSEGKIVKALLEGGGRLGVSTRALGEVESKGNYSRVTKLLLNAVDVVNTPSGQDCYVNSLTESANWILNESGIWMQEQMSKGKNVDISSFLQYTEDAIKKLKL